MPTAQKSVLVINGPNLNMLGVREPQVYGKSSLKDVEDLCRKTAEALGLEADCRQSNHEGEIVSWIQSVRDTHGAIVINPAAYSHTSIAIMEALTLSELPTVEVHISNIFSREDFRHHSFVSKVASATICGCGIDGYAYAMQTAAKLIGKG